MFNITQLITQQLKQELATALAASEEARASATHSENIAENKYDTLAVEAAYLAHGQSIRILELQESINLYTIFSRPRFNQQSSIQLGAIVDLENAKEDILRFFIGPAAGGLRLNTQPRPTQITTVGTPLGQALLNKHIDDDISFNINEVTQVFTVIDIQ